MRSLLYRSAFASLLLPLCVQVKSLKSEWLKLENKVNSQNCLFYYLKIIWKFYFEVPNIFGGSMNHCEAIQPGKNEVVDRVCDWELVSYWPVLLYFGLESVDYFFRCYQFFWISGWYFLQHDHCAAASCTQSDPLRYVLFYVLHVARKVCRKDNR